MLCILHRQGEKRLCDNKAMAPYYFFLAGFLVDLLVDFLAVDFFGAAFLRALVFGLSFPEIAFLHSSRVRSTGSLSPNTFLMVIFFCPFPRFLPFQIYGPKRPFKT
jgi:hypothetical protein